MTITYHSPADLIIDPQLGYIPTLPQISRDLMQMGRSQQARAAGAELEAEHAALWQSLDEQGILEPLKGYPCPDSGALIICDGRHRLQWATHNDMPSVPVHVLDSTTGSAIAQASVIGRRHWTKGQRAWLAVMLNPAVSGVRRGQRGIAKKDPTESDLISGAKKAGKKDPSNPSDQP
ncbi:MAG: hypothetical protein ACRC2U_18465, partial [Aeromonas sp.]